MNFNINIAAVGIWVLRAVLCLIAVLAHESATQVICVVLGLLSSLLTPRLSSSPFDIIRRHGSIITGWLRLVLILAIAGIVCSIIALVSLQNPGGDPSDHELLEWLLGSFSTQTTWDAAVLMILMILLGVVCILTLMAMRALMAHPVPSASPVTYRWGWNTALLCVALLAVAGFAAPSVASAPAALCFIAVLARWLLQAWQPPALTLQTLPVVPAVAVAAWLACAVQPIGAAVAVLAPSRGTHWAGFHPAGSAAQEASAAAARFLGQSESSAVESLRAGWWTAVLAATSACALLPVIMQNPLPALPAAGSTRAARVGTVARRSSTVLRRASADTAARASEAVSWLYTSLCAALQGYSGLSIVAMFVLLGAVSFPTMAMALLLVWVCALACTISLAKPGWQRRWDATAAATLAAGVMAVQYVLAAGGLAMGAHSSDLLHLLGLAPAANIPLRNAYWVCLILLVTAVLSLRRGGKQDVPRRASTTWGRAVQDVTSTLTAGAVSTSWLAALVVLYVLGLSHVDLVHTVYLLFMMLALVSPTYRRKSWRALVLYASATVLCLMLWHSLAAHVLDKPALPRWVVDVQPSSLPISLWESNFVSHCLVLSFSAIQLYMYQHTQATPFATQQAVLLRAVPALRWLLQTLFVLQLNAGPWACYLAAFSLAFFPPVSLVNLVTLVLASCAVLAHLVLGTAWTSGGSVRSAAYRLASIRRWFGIMALWLAATLTVRYMYQYEGVSAWVQARWEWDWISLQDVGLTTPQSGSTLYMHLLDSSVLLGLVLLQIRAMDVAITKERDDLVGCIHSCGRGLARLRACCTGQRRHRVQRSATVGALVADSGEPAKPVPTIAHRSVLRGPAILRTLSIGVSPAAGQSLAELDASKPEPTHGAQQLAAVAADGDYVAMDSSSGRRGSETDSEHTVRQGHLYRSRESSRVDTSCQRALRGLAHLGQAIWTQVKISMFWHSPKAVPLTAGLLSIYAMDGFGAVLFVGVVWTMLSWRARPSNAGPGEHGDAGHSRCRLRLASLYSVPLQCCRRRCCCCLLARAVDASEESDDDDSMAAQQHSREYLLYHNKGKLRVQNPPPRYVYDFKFCFQPGGSASQRLFALRPVLLRPSLVSRRAVRHLHHPPPPGELNPAHYPSPAALPLVHVFTFAQRRAQAGKPLLAVPTWQGSWKLFALLAVVCMWLRYVYQLSMFGAEQHWWAASTARWTWLGLPRATNVPGASASTASLGTAMLVPMAVLVVCALARVAEGWQEEAAEAELRKRAWLHYTGVGRALQLDTLVGLRTTPASAPGATAGSAAVPAVPEPADEQGNNDIPGELASAGLKGQDAPVVGAESDEESDAEGLCSTSLRVRQPASLQQRPGIAHAGAAARARPTGHGPVLSTPMFLPAMLSNPVLLRKHVTVSLGVDKLLRRYAGVLWRDIACALMLTAAAAHASLSSVLYTVAVMAATGMSWDPARFRGVVWPLLMWMLALLALLQFAAQYLPVPGQYIEAVPDAAWPPEWHRVNSVWTSWLLGSQPEATMWDRVPFMQVARPGAMGSIPAGAIALVWDLLALLAAGAARAVWNQRAAYPNAGVQRGVTMSAMGVHSMSLHASALDITTVAGLGRGAAKILERSSQRSAVNSPVRPARNADIFSTMIAVRILSRAWRGYYQRQAWAMVRYARWMSSQLRESGQAASKDGITRATGSAAAGAANLDSHSANALSAVPILASSWDVLQLYLASTSHTLLLLGVFAIAASRQRVDLIHVGYLALGMLWLLKHKSLSRAGNAWWRWLRLYTLLSLLVALVLRAPYIVTARQCSPGIDCFSFQALLVDTRTAVAKCSASPNEACASSEYLSSGLAMYALIWAITALQAIVFDSPAHAEARLYGNRENRLATVRAAVATALDGLQAKLRGQAAQAKAVEVARRMRHLVRMVGRWESLLASVGGGAPPASLVPHGGYGSGAAPALADPTDEDTTAPPAPPLSTSAACLTNGDVLVAWAWDVRLLDQASSSALPAEPSMVGPHTVQLVGEQSAAPCPSAHLRLHNFALAEEEFTPAAQRATEIELAHLHWRVSWCRTGTPAMFQHWLVSPWATLRTGMPNGLGSAVIRGLAPGTWHVRVAAASSAGAGAWSTPVTVVVSPAVHVPLLPSSACGMYVADTLFQADTWTRIERPVLFSRAADAACLTDPGVLGLPGYDAAGTGSVPTAAPAASVLVPAAARTTAEMAPGGPDPSVLDTCTLRKSGKVRVLRVEKDDPVYQGAAFETRALCSEVAGLALDVLGVAAPAPRMSEPAVFFTYLKQQVQIVDEQDVVYAVHRAKKQRSTAKQLALADPSNDDEMSTLDSTPELEHSRGIRHHVRRAGAAVLAGMTWLLGTLSCFISKHVDATLYPDSVHDFQRMLRQLRLKAWFTQHGFSRHLLWFGFMLWRWCSSHSVAIVSIMITVALISDGSLLTLLPVAYLYLYLLVRWPRPSPGEWRVLLLWYVGVVALKYAAQLPLTCMQLVRHTATWGWEWRIAGHCAAPPDWRTAQRYIQATRMVGITKLGPDYGGPGFLAGVGWDVAILVTLLWHRYMLQRKGHWREQYSAASEMAEQILTADWAVAVTGGVAPGPDSGTKQVPGDQQHLLVSESLESAAAAELAEDEEDEAELKDRDDVNLFGLDSSRPRTGSAASAPSSGGAAPAPRRGGLSAPLPPAVTGLPPAAPPLLPMAGSSTGELAPLAEEPSDGTDSHSRGRSRSSSDGSEQSDVQRAEEPGVLGSGAALKARTQRAGTGARSIASAALTTASAIRLREGRAARRAMRAMSIVAAAPSAAILRGARELQQLQIATLQRNLDAASDGTRSRAGSVATTSELEASFTQASSPMPSITNPVMAGRAWPVTQPPVSLELDSDGPSTRAGSGPDSQQKPGLAFGAAQAESEMHSEPPANSWGCCCCCAKSAAGRRPKHVVIAMRSDKPEAENASNDDAALVQAGGKQRPVGRRVVRGLHNAHKRALAMWRSLMHEHGVSVLAPGRDLYVWTVCIQLLALLCTVAVWGDLTAAGSGFSTELQTNQFSGSLVGVMLLQLVWMIADRVAFLYRSLPMKWAVQLVSFLAVHAALFFALPVSTGVRWGAAWSGVFMYILCVAYFAVGAMQLHLGWSPGPPRDSLVDILTQFNYFPPWPVVFKIYVAIPFLFEIRALLDWLAARTALDPFMWLKVAAVENELHMSQCEMKYRTRYASRLSGGMPQNWLDKLLTGFLIFLGLLAVILLPIVLFSGLNPTLSPNPVSSLHAQLEFVGASNAYHVWSVSTTAVLVPATSMGDSYWAQLTELAGTGSDSGSPVRPDWAPLTQVAVLSPFADQAWTASPPAIAAMSDLLLACGNSSARDGVELTRVDAQLTFSFTRGGPPGNEDVILTTANQLAAGDCMSLYTAVQQRKSSQPVVLPGLVPLILRLPASANPIEVSNARTPAALHLHANAQSGEQWWSLSTHNYTLPRPALPNGSPAASGVPLNLYSDKVAPSVLLSTLGATSVLGLYVTVVLAVGRLSRSGLLDPMYRTPYFELPDPSPLLDLCEGIKAARTGGYASCLKDEVKLFAMLIRLLRSPEVLLRVSQPRWD